MLDGILYNIIYSEREGTIRFHNDEKSPMKCSNGERLIGQVQGSEDAYGVADVIRILRPDLKTNDSEIVGEE
ncbi:gp618 [Bacillus phage G]|uniref:Gp618 n=1 Tax=Bacillus phage G TaxID=2884420 RepID=G3MAZ8_9CAUD|nr:gp618 [Bacillus phage G]AEO93863.1 gp618 [Bacillus phage G]